MINDKIRAGAEMLVMADAQILDKGYLNALKSASPEESVRAMFLAGLQMYSHGSALTRYWGFLHARLHESEFRMTPEIQMLADVLKDEDLLSKADRKACVDHVKKDILVHLVGAGNEIGMEIIEAAFEIDYDPTTAREMWKKALSGLEDGARRLLAKGVDPSALEPAALAHGPKHPPSVEVYVRALSDARLLEVIQQLRDHTFQKTGSGGDQHWRLQECAPLLSAMVAEHVTRHGGADGVGVSFFEQFVNDNYHLNDRFNPFMPQLLRIAEGIGRIDDERLYRYLVNGAINHVEPTELARFLAKGLPTQRTVSQPSGGVSIQYLVDGAKLDRVEVIAHAMNPADRDHYLDRGFAERASEISQLWNTKRSVLDSNIITALHAAGFDVGRQRVDGEGKKRWPHEAFSLFGSVSRPVFTCLHALGVYPQDLRIDDMSPLHLAAMHNDEKAIRALAARGYDVNEPAGPNAKPGEDRIKQAGNTPLVMAVLYKHKDAMQALIELGADVGVKAATGASLMQLAKDEDTKRLIRAARTGASVTNAMKGAEQQPSVSREQPGVL